uniref:Uncharacterized protein n=1 Tax=Arundo donax TaxID=35708 RepID=A0A0A9DAS9_ARUDO
MKNFPYEDAGIGTGLKFSIRHISKPSFCPEPRKAGSRSLLETDILDFIKNSCLILLPNET